MDWIKDLRAADWAIVFATLLGPILAVQAQKTLEGLRDKRNGKLWVFRTLMATRGTKVSQDHVRALNMIDLTFYGSKVFFWRWQSGKEKTVATTWKEYLDNLATDMSNMSDAQKAVHWGKRDTLFVNLLTAMGADVGFQFDSVVVQKGGYVPVAHGWLEEKQGALLSSAIDVLQGTKSLQMDIRSFPVDSEVAATHKQMLQQVVNATKDGKLDVSIKT